MRAAVFAASALLVSACAPTVETTSERVGNNGSATGLVTTVPDDGAETSDNQFPTTTTRVATPPTSLSQAFEDAGGKIELEENPEETGEAEGVVEVCTATITIPQRSLGFERNSAEITDYEFIGEVAAAVEGAESIEVIGHASSDGDAQSNLELSQRRAEAVKIALQQAVLSAPPISSVGRGEAEPLVANDTEEHREINRRVEIKATFLACN